MSHLSQHDIEQEDPRGRTPLELAVSLGNLESVRVLLRHNANVGKESCQGWAGTTEGRGAPPRLAVGLVRQRVVRPGAVGELPPSSPVPLVLQEAVSTGDPEMVQLVLQYRDYQRATQRLAGIPELLSKLRQVQQGAQVWPGGRGRVPRQGAMTDYTGVPRVTYSVRAACFPNAVDDIPLSGLQPGVV